MAFDPERIAGEEFARLRELLAERDVADGNCSYANVWAAITEWMLAASGESTSDQFLVGFECACNPNDRDGDHDHPDPPDGVPDGPLFNVVFLWDFMRGGEAGAEFWYPADDDWEALTLALDWEPDHPINHHSWGYAGPRAASFVEAVESTPYAAMAARKPPALLRVFWTGAPEIIVHCTR